MNGPEQIPKSVEQEKIDKQLEQIRARSEHIRGVENKQLELERRGISQVIKKTSHVLRPKVLSNKIPYPVVIDQPELIRDIDGSWKHKE